MIYLVMILIGLAISIYITVKKATDLFERIFMPLSGLYISFVICLFMSGIFCGLYDGGYETIITNTDNDNIIMIQEVRLDREYCDKWLMGNYIVNEEMQYVEKKGE